MKILLDVPEDKVDFILELLKNFKYVKVKPITINKFKTLEGIKMGIDEMRLIKQGELKGIPVKDLLNEL